MPLLKDLLWNLQQCTEKLEEEIKTNINDVHNLVTENIISETEVALEKAKDYHYKEIMKFLNEILNNVKLILFHEKKIRQYSDETNFTKEDLKKMSYVQRQVKCFSQGQDIVNTKREKRRVASEISMESLEDWKRYLDRKNEEASAEETEAVAVNNENSLSRRQKFSIRKKKKFISSTLDGFLEDELGNQKLQSISEDAVSDEEQNSCGDLESISNKMNEGLICKSFLNPEERILNQNTSYKNESKALSLICSFKSKSDEKLHESSPLESIREEASYNPEENTNKIAEEFNCKPDKIEHTNLNADIPGELARHNNLNNERQMNFFDMKVSKSENNIKQDLNSKRLRQNEKVSTRPRIVEVIYKNKTL